LLIVAAGLLYGDGIITPAISVISAVEGLGVATSAFTPFIIPITIAILTGLFLIQSKGTAKVGAVFGPVMLVWFATLGVLGVMHITQNPQILWAFNPIHAITFFQTHSLHTTLLVMGSVMLVVTGGEALYADMGHFGRFPIRFSWYTIALPGLLLNYLGQGAYLLSGQHILQENIFFSMAPAWGLYPLVILSTIATVIASQALISGAFSLTTQAIALGLFPYFDVDHTNEEHKGQIYISTINWALYAGAIILVLVFKSSSNLASMYGMAVSGVMLITTIGMIIISIELWKWNRIGAFAFFVPLACIDLFFLTANSLKFIQGGYIPLTIGLLILYMSITWKWGRALVEKTFAKYESITMADIVKMKSDTENMLDKTLIIMSPEPVNSLNAKLPPLTQIYFDRYHVIPKNLLFVHVAIKDYPYVRERFSINTFYQGKYGTLYGVTIYFGYMEDPDVESVLEELANHQKINVDHDHKKWLFRVVHERIHISDKLSPMRRFQYEIFKIIDNNSSGADFYFGLGRKHGLTVEVLPIHLQ
jgi:KUP system potassium uptake protein